MDQLNIAALDAFTAAVRSFLTQNKPSVQFRSLNIRPTGLGGFVGQNKEPDPPGELIGRKIEGTVVVAAKGVDQTALGTAATTIIRDLLGADRKNLIAAGIYRLDLDALDTPRTIRQNELEQDVAFAFCFEYVQRPETAGALIKTIKVNPQPGAIPKTFEITRSQGQ